MILEETLNKLIRDTVDLLLATPGYTIKAKQKDAPRPTGPYGAVDFINDTNIGWEQRTFNNNMGDDDLTETIQGMREIMFSIDFYRDDSVDNSRRVRTGLIRKSIQELFRAADISLTSRSEVREISEPLASGFEERSQFDIVISAVGDDADIVRSILSVDIAGEVHSRGKKHNFNIEVS